MLRKLVTGMSVIIAVLFFIPYMLGVWIQYHYPKTSTLTLFPSTFATVTVKSYTRHWLSSDVILTVTSLDKKYEPALKLLGITLLHPESQYLTVSQHIWHVPIIFITHWRATNVEVYLKQFGAKVHVGELSGFFHSADDPLASPAGIILSDIQLTQPQSDIDIPKLKLEFKDKNKFSFYLPKLTYTDMDSNTFSMANIKFNSVSKLKNAALGSAKEFNIERMDYNSHEIGSLHIRFLIKNIDLTVIDNLIQTFKQTLQTGELYRNQLMERLKAQIPRFIKADSSIKLTEFTLQTPNGNWVMQGQIAWPSYSYTVPHRFSDLSDMASAQLSLRIPKQLTNQIINFLSQTPYFRSDITPTERAQAIAAELQLDFTLRKNGYVLNQYIDDGILPEDIAENAFKMQENLVAMDYYTRQIKTLLLERQISLGMSYVLNSQYFQLHQPYLVLLGLANKFQKEITAEFEKNILDGIKKGYVFEDNNKFYFASWQWTAGELDAAQNIKPTVQFTFPDRH